MTKICGKCGSEKPASEFHKSAKSKDGLQHRCKGCHRADVRESYAQDPAPFLSRVTERARREPEKIARNGLRQRARAYGLDPDEVEAAFSAHDGLCDICGHPPDPGHKRHKRLHIDHDHAAEGGERFRGFLCHLCNSGLGGFKDDPVLIDAAIQYLARHGV